MPIHRMEALLPSGAQLNAVFGADRYRFQNESARATRSTRRRQCNAKKLKSFDTGTDVRCDALAIHIARSCRFGDCPILPDLARFNSVKPHTPDTL